MARGRGFGVRRKSRGRRVRRNSWSEQKIAKSFGPKWVIAKAPGHHSAALKGWAKRKGKKASAAKKVASVVKVAAAPKKHKARKSRRKSAKVSSVMKKSRGKKHHRKAAKKTRRNPSRRRRSHTMVLVPRKRRHHKKSRRNAGHRFKMKKHSRRSRRNRMRRNGVMGIAVKGVAVAAGLGLAVWGGSQLSALLADKIGTSIPDSVKEWMPALVTGAAAAGAVYVAKKLKVPEKFMNGILYGGIAATVLNLIAHIRVNTASGQQSLAQFIGLPLSSVHVDAPAPAQSAAVTGDSGDGKIGRIGNYGVFGYQPVAGLGNVIDVGGRPLAVEGLLQVPGAGALAVEGVGDFVVGGAGLGDVFSNSVLGTQNPSRGPAPNPFAPGIREGNRGTMNETHVMEVGNDGSLSGNIFS